MMADNVEHVITYWLIFERFHSPALAGFAVISHWAPFLLFGITFGALADRFDCRRIIQAGQALFILASFSWAVLFLTNTLEAWHAVILLVIHGMAGALWSPASQHYIYDVVGGAEDLQSGVRLAATARQIGILFGPAVGGGLLLLLGPANGLLVNCLLYLPLILWLFRTPFTGHMHRGGPVAAANALTFADAWRTLQDVRHQPVILAMVVLGGATSLLVGNAYQAQMPQYAADIPGALMLPVIRFAQSDDKLKGLNGIRVMFSLSVEAGAPNGTVFADKILLYSQRGTPPNHNPTMTGVTLTQNGVLWKQLTAGAALSLPIGPLYGVRPNLAADAREEYDTTDLQGRTVHLKEDPMYAFFTTPGAEFDRDTAYEPLDGVAPPDGLTRVDAFNRGTGTIWVVVRDGRGGESWIQQAFKSD